jgi:hypothetical protein
MKLKELLLVFCIFIAGNIVSQKIPRVTIKVKSTVPDTLYFRKSDPIIISIQNLSGKDINVLNVPVLNINYEVCVRKGKEYFSIDSNCKFLPQPIMPKGGIKNIPFKKAKKINIPFFFPPGCCLDLNGDYKVRYVFGFNVKNKFYEVKTDWYEFNTVFQ